MRINSIDDLPKQHQDQARAKLNTQPYQPIRIVGQENGEAVMESVETKKDAEKMPVKRGSQLEQDFAYLLAVNGLPEPEREAVLIPGRKFRSDFWYSRAGLVIECEGGVFGKVSGHNSGIGIERDAAKSRLYSLHGIRLYRVTRKSLDEKPLEIIEQIKAILAPWYTE